MGGLFLFAAGIYHPPRGDEHQRLGERRFEHVLVRIYWGGIFLFDIKTQKSRLLAERSVAAWSLGGEWIAFYDYAAKNRLYIMHPDGSGERSLALPEEWATATAMSDRAMQEIQWTTDGKGLFITAHVNAFPTLYQLMYYDLASETLTHLLEYSEKGFVTGRRMDLSPDGQWIILESITQDTHFPIGLNQNWHVCNQEGCTQIIPPIPGGASACIGLAHIIGRSFKRGGERF